MMEPIKTLDRTFVIDRLREHLLRFTNEDHSICAEAGRRGIFCRGFRQFSDPELRLRFDFIAKNRPGIRRQELEELANQYALARQEVLHVPFACDAAAIDGDTCLGWDEFSDSDLARFYEAWYGEKIGIERV